METSSQREARGRAQPVISAGRFAGACALVALILFSSTKTADELAQAAYKFYLPTPDDLLKGPNESLLHHLAEKAVHITLFFSLGAWLASGLRLPRMRKVWTAAAICLVVGAASETLQIFTGRDAALRDVLLNSASGLLGAAAAVLAERSTDEGRH